ncbi:MAG: transmembrane 220 family protein [Cyclobacteriaceae bacterium]
MNSRTIHYALSILFLLFATVQYNDPDPLLWILIYGSVSLIALLKIYLGQVNFNKLIITLIVIFTLYALAYIPSFSDLLSKPDKSELVGQMKATKPWIEGTRELGGLLIAIGAMVYLLKSKRVKNQ